MGDFLVAQRMTTVSLLMMARLPIGVEIASFAAIRYAATRFATID